MRGNIMAYLFKFTTKPFQPVCKGELIFYIETDSYMDAWIRLGELVKSGYPFPEVDHVSSLLRLIGTFEPSPTADFTDGVITYQNGEY